MTTNGLKKYKIRGIATVWYDAIIEAPDKKTAYNIAILKSENDEFDWEISYTEEIEPDFNSIQEL